MMSKKQPPVLIGVAGPQGVGKTTLMRIAAETLARTDGRRSVQAALADPLYEMARVLTGDSNFAKNREYPLGPSEDMLAGRPILQALGTDICRKAFRPDIWCWLLKKRQADQDVVFVDDVRFENEARQMDALCFLDYADAPEQQGAQHESEQALERLRTWTLPGLRFERRGETFFAPSQVVSAVAVLMTVAQDLLRAREIVKNQDPDLSSEALMGVAEASQHLGNAFADKWSRAAAKEILRLRGRGSTSAS